MTVIHGGVDEERAYTLVYPAENGMAELYVLTLGSGEIRASFRYCPRIKLWERHTLDAGGFPVRQTYHAKQIVHGVFRFGRSEKFNEVRFMRSPGAQRLLERVKEAEEWAAEDERLSAENKRPHSGDARQLFDQLMMENRNARVASQRAALSAAAGRDSVSQETDTSTY